MHWWKERHFTRVPVGERSAEAKARCLAFGLLLTCVAAFLTVFPHSLIRYLNGRIFDVLLQSLPREAIHPLPVIVAIDDASLSEYGQWPWPRLRLAGLLQKIHDLGASAIGLDLVMAEPDRCSLKQILDEFVGGSDHPFPFDLQRLPDNDALLARAVKRAPVALGYKFLFHASQTESKDRYLHPLLNVIQREVPGYPLHPLQADGVLCNLPVFSASASASGFINAGADPDGVLRRVPLIAQYRGGLYPSLALACLILHSGHPVDSIASGQDGMLLHWNGRQIPLDADGNLLLRYRGEHRTFPYYSAADILSGRIPADALQGKIAFIGASATGLGDWHVTPVDSRFPGPEVHATVVDNLLSDNFLHRPGWANGAELFSVLVLGTMLAMAMAYGNSAVGFSVSAVVAVLAVWIFRWLFYDLGMYLSPLMPLATLFILFSGVSVLNFGYAEQNARRRTRSMLRAQETTIIRLAALAETRDPLTGRHLQRTQRYVQALAKELGRDPRYRRQLDHAAIDFLSKCAPLHDIGKVGIPDHILLKQERLTPEEFDLIKTHTLIGAKVLSETDGEADEPADDGYLKLAREMAASHHEKWDGTGYPIGLKGDDIPLAGRIMALADVYDALTTRRSYKTAFLHEKAREIIVREKGRQFDPDVVDAFLEVEQTFQRIAEAFRED